MNKSNPKTAWMNKIERKSFQVQRLYFCVTRNIVWGRGMRVLPNFFTDGDVLLDGVAFWQLGFRLQQSYWNFRDFGSQKILVSKDLKIGTCFLNSPNSRIFAYNDDLPKRLFIVDAWSEMTKFGPRKLTFVSNLPLGCGLTDPNRL